MHEICTVLLNKQKYKILLNKNLIILTSKYFQLNINNRAFHENYYF